jgi:hypothetical protein
MEGLESYFQVRHGVKLEQVPQCLIRNWKPVWQCLTVSAIIYMGLSSGSSVSLSFSEKIEKISKVTVFFYGTRC